MGSSESKAKGSFGQKEFDILINDRKLIKFDISLIYVVILWPNGCLVC
jgi:hypothetical protein